MSDSPEDIEAATAEGWNENYDGDNPKSAKEFLHDGSFFKKIDELKVDNARLKSSMGQLTSHYEKVVASERKKSEVEYTRRIAELKAEKVEAMDDGDNKRVVDIDEEIRTTARSADIEPMQNVAFNEWLRDNAWYDNNPFLRAETDKIGEAYYQSGLRERELYDAIGEHVKELYPAKFGNTNRAKPPSVEGDTGGARTPSGKISEKELTPDERKIFKGFKSQKIFKDDAAIQKYFRQVLEVR